MDGRREPSADATAPKSSTSSQQAARKLILSDPNPTPPGNAERRYSDSERTNNLPTKYHDYSDDLATTCDPAARLPGLRQPPKPPFDDDDNVSVSTDASCGSSNLSWETGSETGRKTGKKKKSGAARRKRKKERIDASLELYEIERTILR